MEGDSDAKTAAAAVNGGGDAPPAGGIGLCLSGGGYRAMVFHIGTLLRLNELGLLPKITRISSVSGGSITAGMLGYRWHALDFDAQGVASRLDEEVVQPLRRLAGRTIDAGSILKGVLLPGPIGDHIADAYDEVLFHGATMSSLPPEPPRFVINATNVQTAALVRFTRDQVRDWRAGSFDGGSVRLAQAVAASSAFPPVLSPITLKLGRPVDPVPEGADLARPPFSTEAVLTDGGVYDNMGLETVWKRCRTILVSDAGGKVKPQEKPARDWLRHATRVLDVIDNQVRSLRRRGLIEAYRSGQRDGAFWGIRTRIDEYPASGTLPCPAERTAALAAIPTRLARMELRQQQRLINWGYAICDAAVRAYYVKNAPAPADFPYPAIGV